MHRKKDFKKAEEIYKDILNSDPHFPTSLCNYSTLLLISNQHKKSVEYIKLTLEHNNKKTNQIAVEALMNYALILKINSKNDTPALSRVKYIFQVGFIRNLWLFHLYLKKAQPVLNESDYKLYKAITEAILDSRETRILNIDQRWRTLIPII